VGDEAEMLMVYYNMLAPTHIFGEKSNPEVAQRKGEFIDSFAFLSKSLWVMILMR